MIVQQIVGGLAMGSIYTLVAIGYTLIWRALKVLNFSQGELLMLGAYMGYSFNVLLGINYFASLLFSMIFGCIIGIVYAFILNPVRGRKSRVDTMVITIGLAIIIRNLCRIIWGAVPLVMPGVFSSEPFNIFGNPIQRAQVYISIISLGLVITLTFFFSYTRWGRAMRAAAQDRDTARLMGVPVFLTDSLTLMISTALATSAGILISPIYFITADMGAYNGLKAFLASTIGGLGSVSGGFIGGYFLGIIEYLGAIYISSGYKDILTFIILIIVLIVLPNGFSSLLKSGEEKV
ncbi:MAG: branched-chain amino acid ABC transporter permease [Bacillota bacterium]|nr:branched-chain amino acid ABC transporter permease [Bacillota bacterium]